MNRDCFSRALTRLGINLSNPSWAQCGEDLIMSFALSQAGIQKPFYLDLGAHHPVRLSNTHLFYRRGGCGINVEANPKLARYLSLRRPRDITLNAGVGPSDGSLQGLLPFYVMAVPTLSTFSKNEAERIERETKIKCLRVENVPVMSVEKIVDAHSGGRGIDLLTIDIEGWDERILMSLDYSRFRPLLICAETIDYHEDKTIEKNNALIGFLCGKGYFVYADTYVNTIFIDKGRWPGPVLSTVIGSAQG